MSRVVVVAGGPAIGDFGPTPPADCLVIAADSGADHALAVGWPVHHLVGDLDSISALGRRRAEAQGAVVHQHRADKDSSDLELALDLAIELGADRIEVLLSAAGRLDHVLFAVAVLARRAYRRAAVTARVDGATLTIVHDRAVLDGRPGDTVSLMAMGGPARVTTRGLVFPLRDEVLEPTSSRGLSNRFASEEVEVMIHDGVIVMVAPAGV